MENDFYQERYLSHQKRKGEAIKKDPVPSQLLKRRSVRVYTNQEIEDNKLTEIIDATMKCPSSCNRHAIQVISIRGVKKAKIDGLLVGGKNWIGKANTILLFYADMRAYKSPNEVGFMPWLDAGVALMAAHSRATEMGIGSCIVNPNIRAEDKVDFYKEFPSQEYLLFVGALPLGYPGE